MTPMTARVPLVCTPEELGELLFWSGEVAIELYRLRIGGGNHDAANHAKDRRDAALAALFRPAEEPEVDAATRAEIEKGLAHSARGEVEPYTSAAPAAPCDHPAEDCLPEMTVGPRYGHLRCLRCGAFISPAPAAPPPAGEPAWMTSELRKNLDCMVFVDAQVFSQARASMVAAIDHAVLSALAALRAEMKGELEAKA